MLVSLFRTNRPAVLLLLAVLVPLVLLGTWDGPAGTGTAHMPLYALVRAVVGGSAWGAWALGVLVTGLVCVQLTALANDTDLLDQRTHLPALLFPLLVGAFAQGALLDPALAGMPLVVAAMRRVFRADPAGNVLPHLFQAGFLLGVAALFFLPWLFLVVVVFTTLSITRPFRWREYAVPVVGAAVALYLGWSAVHLFGWGHWEPFRSVWPGPAPPAPPRGQRIALYATCALLALIAVPVYAAGYQRSVVRVRNRRASFMGLMAAMLVLVLLMHALTGRFPPAMAAMPLAVFLGHALTGRRFAWARETLVAALLLCALWAQW
ncbi:MAG: DUF6427 family protein [Flavobacteriales bacterium]|jgi:hypothetical protein|nr:DUF6427 family protein [Flavobacteriales bacterium]